MDTPKDEKESACSCESSCCCGSSCLGGKALVVLILLLVGGVLGYLMSVSCLWKKSCHMMMSQPCPMMGQQSTPPAKK
ncbi:MAG: hypothetical protein LHV69_06475 [Elusimicrobia bacterium]|nr:hypothetical protein [Candidatus Obscuribacterium magneticum]